MSALVQIGAAPLHMEAFGGWFSVTLKHKFAVVHTYDMC